MLYYFADHHGTAVPPAGIKGMEFNSRNALYGDRFCVFIRLDRRFDSFQGSESSGLEKPHWLSAYRLRWSLPAVELLN